MSSESQPIFHLTVDIALEIHSMAIQEFGGALGIRDQNLLESAIATPQSLFAGKSPYSDVVEMAAAYLFYLCKNHPFIDGNKRTALGACLVFLQINRIQPKPDHDDWEKLVLKIASSELDREKATRELRKLVEISHPS
jgi:death on curing protein